MTSSFDNAARDAYRVKEMEVRRAASAARLSASARYCRWTSINVVFVKIYKVIIVF